MKDEYTRFYVEHGILQKELVRTLDCHHAEVDTRIILHMIHADKTTPGDLVIRGSDIYISVTVTPSSPISYIDRLDGSRNKRDGKSEAHKCHQDNCCNRFINV